jgi:hypothetical protein
MTWTKPPRIFVLRLRALPNIDAIKALRMLLKRALRTYGFRAVSVHEEIDSQTKENCDG